MEKLKIVWLCHFSNPLVRKHLKNGVGKIEYLARKFMKKPIQSIDFAQWNTNALKEFEKFTDEVDLHVISPGYAMKNKESIFVENGIHYYFFKDERSLFGKILNYFIKQNFIYKKNRKYIANKILTIKPDLVHVIGTENPAYSLAALDIPETIPSFVQLQTLVIDPDFKKNYPISNERYQYISNIERKILEKANYIGTVAKKFISYINLNVKIKHPIISTTLALTEPVNLSSGKKDYDFVYFALNVNKAVDYAIEAFAIAHRFKPSITLDVVGECSVSLKIQLDRRIKELGLQHCIFFEGKLPTHDDVICQIKKSHFALLPLKIDLISGTIREAMANGLPVVTTVTPATPDLNKDRESVLLSPIGDFESMAKNMLKLLDDEQYAKMIRKNAGITASERVSNELHMRKWVDAYRACIENFKNGTQIPQNLL